LATSTAAPDRGKRDAVSDARIYAARARWERLAADVRALGSSDQDSLDALYVRAAAAIRADEAAWHEMLAREMGTIAGASLEESFFSVSATVRSSHRPARVLEAIWSYAAPADAPGHDAHHERLTPAVRYARVEAFAARELREQLAGGWVSVTAPEARALVPRLASRVAGVKSLDLAIELAQLMAALHASQAEIEAALESRSERDRALVLGMVGRR
jgi:hypothetical protein